MKNIGFLTFFCLLSVSFYEKDFVCFRHPNIGFQSEMGDISYWRVPHQINFRKEDFPQNTL
jgi:hypothetical protein